MPAMLREEARLQGEGLGIHRHRETALISFGMIEEAAVTRMFEERKDKARKTNPRRLYEAGNCDGGQK